MSFLHVKFMNETTAGDQTTAMQHTVCVAFFARDHADE